MIFAALLASPPGQAASSSAVDREVISAALRDFVRRSDAGFYDPDGKLLIRRQTEKQIVGFDHLKGFDGDCPIDSALYEVLIKRNQAKGSAVGLVEPSREWRFVRRDEEKSVTPQFPPISGANKQERLKTVVGLYHPAISDAGHQAVVTFHFAWSMHSAAARYLTGAIGNRMARHLLTTAVLPVKSMTGRSADR